MMRTSLRSYVARYASITLIASLIAPAAHASPADEAVAVPLASSESTAATTQQIHLLDGRSTLINAARPIGRFAVTVPDVADAVVTTPRQLLVHGKAPGKITLLLWDQGESVASYEVIVQRDLTELNEQMTQLFPTERIGVSVNGKDIVLSGTVSTKHVVDRAADVAAGFVEKRENVVNLLAQRDGLGSTQIMLQVRFAEVSRSALTELGVSLFTGGGGYKGFLGRSATQQFAAPAIERSVADRGKLTFTDFLNLFLFDTETQLGTTIKALQTRGLFQSLAEPNLIAQDGKEASFLAGGEYPYPALQGGVSTNTAITVQFKEFGIRLNFVPTVLSNQLIHLKVRPEVSALDFTNAVSVQGFRIPSLSTRRAETEVELRDGQTFAIAGLLNNSLTQSMQKIPGIGDIPILGMLFRSKAMQKAQTELVVMITPHILPPDARGAAPSLPPLDKPFLQKPPETLAPPPPPPYTQSPAAASETVSGPAADAPATTAPRSLVVLQLATPPAAAPAAGEKAPVTPPGRDSRKKTPEKTAPIPPAAGDASASWRAIDPRAIPAVADDQQDAAEAAPGRTASSAPPEPQG